MTFSIQEVSEQFRVSKQTVLGWIAAGELGAINVARTPGGRPRWRITPDAVRAFEMLREAQPPIPAPSKRRKRSAGVVEFY